MPPLFSGNGRHRRPRQAPSFVVTAGVAGAGIAIPLLGAGTASAADTETWDKVAECESGGLWSADEDNGYYGGLQLDQETWVRHGGTEFAERADFASRGQQIEVAERILRADGTDTWSDCAGNAGLSKDSTETPDLDGDGTDGESERPVPESPYPGDPSEQVPEDGTDGEDGSGAGDSGDSADPPGSDDDFSELPDHAPPPSPSPSEKPEPPAGGSADPSDSPDPSSPDGEESSPGPTDPAGPGSGPGGGSGGGSGDGSESGSGDGSDSGSGDDRDDEHPSREDGRGEEAGSGDDHQVSPGESLSGIADELDLRGGWPELYERNRGVVGTDPDLILPGQELRL